MHTTTQKLNREIILTSKASTEGLGASLWQKKRRKIETDSIFKQIFDRHREEIRLKRIGTISGSMEIGTLSPKRLRLIN